MLTSPELASILPLLIPDSKEYTVVNKSQVTTLSLDQYPQLCIVENNSDLADFVGSKVEPVSPNSFRLWTKLNYSLTNAQALEAKAKHEQRKREYAKNALDRENAIERVCKLMAANGVPRDLCIAMIVRSRTTEDLTNFANQVEGIK